MGSYIGIGFVYDTVSRSRIEKILESIVRYLLSKNGKITYIKFSKDKDGNQWTEITIDNNAEMELFYEKITKGYYGQINLLCDLFNKTGIKTILRINNLHDNYFDFLLDIPEEQIIETHSTSYLNLITEKIIRFMLDAYRLTNFDYAVCDNEVEIKYSPTEIKLMNKKLYSIALFPSEDKKVRVFTSDCHIDGLT